MAAPNVEKAGGQTGLLEAVALVVGVVFRRVKGVLEGGEPERLELLADGSLAHVLERQGPEVQLNYTFIGNSLKESSLRLVKTVLVI